MIQRLVLGPMRTNTYIVACGKKECIIIDPGPDTDTLCKNLDSLNIVPQAIVFTHGHIDHTSGTLGIQDYFSKKNTQIPVGIHPGDSAYLQEDSRELNRSFLPNNSIRADKTFEAMFQGLPLPDFTLADGDTIPGTTLSIIHTPGHTQGSVCFYDEIKEAVFTGDTLYFDGIGHSNLPGGQPDQIMDSIATKLLTLPDNTRVFPGHGPFTTIEREKRDNQFKTNHGML